MQRRRQREARRRRRNLAISIIGTIAVIGVVVGFIVATNNDSKKPAATKTSASATTSPTASASPSASPTVAAYPCAWTKKGTAAKKATVPPTTKPARTGTTQASVRTTRGTLRFTLNRAAAPCAVESFVSLAKQKFFDSSPCHRLTSGTLSVLQCGDPKGTGQGGPGYTFADELTGKEKYTRGVLAMANGGPNTNGSQFFIVYKASSLPASYTIFGKVSAGLGVVDAVAAKGSTPKGDGKPKLPISITKVTVAA